MPLRDSYPWFATAWKFAHLHAQFADCRRVAASLRKVVRVVVLRSMHANLPDFWAGIQCYHRVAAYLALPCARIMAYCTGPVSRLSVGSAVLPFCPRQPSERLRACIWPSAITYLHACPRAGVKCLAPCTYVRVWGVVAGR